MDTPLKRYTCEDEQVTELVDGHLVLYHDVEPLLRDNARLRLMLAIQYSGGTQGFYHDDGELSDTNERPWIDFKRDSIEAITLAMAERGINRIMTMEDTVPDFAGGVWTDSSFHLWVDTGHTHGGLYLNWGRFGYDNGRADGAAVLIGCASLPAALQLLWAKTGVKLILT